MTWPDFIAAALGVAAALMVCTSQRRQGTTNPQDPPDGDKP